jgi:hypothetical protein
MVVGGASGCGDRVLVSVASAAGAQVDGIGMTGTSTVGTVACGVSSDGSGSVRASIVGGGGIPGADGRQAGMVAVGSQCAGTRTRAASPGPAGSGLAGCEPATPAGGWQRPRRRARNRRKDSIVPADVDMPLSP